MRRADGFTLIEVLVALIIVAFGMGAVLSALSSSADNISALREKTLAEWIAMNQIADTRLSLTPPQAGVTEGDIKDFGNGNWHWRQDVIAMDFPPGMLEIAVRVRRAVPGDKLSPSSGSSTPKLPGRSSSGSSSGAPSSFFSSSGGSYSSGGFSSSGSSSGGFSSGLSQLASSGASLRNLGASKLPDNDKTQQWIATVIGFRGDAISPASGEAPDWNCNSSLGGGGLCTGSSSGASSSSGATLPSINPGTNSGSSGASPTTGAPNNTSIGPPMGSSSGS
jgi:type II secretion system protein I